MSAIDVHTHAFPDEIAERAVTKLAGKADWKPVGMGRVCDLVESMDRADIDLSIVCAIATKPSQTEGIFEWCKRIRSDRIEPFPSIHPRTENPAKWLKRFAKAGFAGIKLHPMYQDFAFDDPRMDVVYLAAIDNELIVASHCGRDIAFPPGDDRASPERLGRVLDRFPQLRMICTHMGGWRAWDEAEKYLLGRDVYLETSFTMPFLDQRRFAEMIRHHGTGKVLFGTDWPWTDQKEQLDHLAALPLTERERRAITFGNAARMLGF